MRGGYRENSGRKKGFSALESEKAREYIVKQVNASLGLIIKNLIKKSIDGDIKATQILFDRAFGKPITPFEATIESSPSISIILDELETDNKYDELYKRQKEQSTGQLVNI
jgi:hypothetical protein